VTILFADVTGSTALAERLDPEQIRMIMARFFDAMTHEIARHEGTVEKFIGDEVMAVFGLPVIHEDDPERAVRAALAMHARLRQLNAEIEPSWESPCGCGSASTAAKWWPTPMPRRRASS
jgi:class 3 adenylate cyclase